jgi:ribosome biogenesis GTPase
LKGRIFKSTGLWYRVETETGEMVDARLRGKLKLKASKTSNPLAVGDYVQMEAINDERVIIDIEERENYIVRKSPHKTAHAHIIAANIDQAVLIATPVFPRTSSGFIDRFLVATESFRIPAVIVFNKKDLLDQETQAYVSDLKTLYNGLGYGCHHISAFDPQDITNIKKVLQGKTSLFSGHSGVGKSTLLNQIDPLIARTTAEVSTFANKGVHTTTFAEMFEPSQGTYIIDTPGIKELGLIDMEPWEISHYFPEMRDLLNACKYHNCLHIHENKCAVKDAVRAGEIAFSRYNSYLSMVEDEDNRR